MLLSGGLDHTGKTLVFFAWLGGTAPESCATYHSSRRGSAGVVALVEGSNGLSCFVCPLNQTNLAFTAVAGKQCLQLLHSMVSDSGDSHCALALPCGVVEGGFLIAQWACSGLFGVKACGHYHHHGPLCQRHQRVALARRQSHAPQKRTPRLLCCSATFHGRSLTRGLLLPPNPPQ